MMDQRFHRLLHLTARRRGDFVVLGAYRTAGHLIDTLRYNLETLPHLFDTDEIAVEAIAVLADRNIEIHLRVDVIGLRFAQIPWHTAAAQHRAREPPIEGIVLADDTDVDRALAKNSVFRQQGFNIVDDPRKFFAKL